MVLLLGVEKAHVAWNANKHILGDVDLHQDKELMECAEDISNWGQVNPFVAVDA